MTIDIFLSQEAIFFLFHPIFEKNEVLHCIEIRDMLARNIENMTILTFFYINLLSYQYMSTPSTMDQEIDVFESSYHSTKLTITRGYL